MRSTAIIFTVTLALTPVSFAAPTPASEVARPVGPVIDWNAQNLARFDAAWLHVKFTEGSSVHLERADGDAVARFVDEERGALTQIDAIVAGARTVRRTFPGDRAQFRAWKLRGEQKSGHVGPDLSLWFDVEMPADRAGLAATINALNARPEVEIAHPAPVCAPASIVPCGLAEACVATPAAGTPDFSDLQDYLYETPVGLDAPSAWAQAGGRGAGTQFIDVELGWVFDHEDFPEPFYMGGGDDPAYRDHGTAVVGEVLGQNNGFGITGFASDARWGTVGIPIGEWPILPKQFMEAATTLDPGDIWLIELQMYPPGRSATPMEYVQVNYDVIWTSSWSLDVVCVEAGANGSQDLDSPVWNGLFDREVRDSGAIMVGAGTPTGRVAESFTNYGSRMDAHAWGSSIVTTGYGSLFSGGSPQREYASDFGGTSGASPMVVGSGLCLQGIARAQIGGPLTPPELRALINTTGIPHLGSRLIGPRPDLGSAVVELLASACPADIDMSGDVAIGDLLAVLAGWGTPDGDVTGDGMTNIADLLAVLAAWGPCDA